MAASAAPTVETLVSLNPTDKRSGLKLGAELHVTLPGAADAETARDVVRATRDNIDVNLSVTPTDGNHYDVT
jgi:hypothetical protein